MSVTWANIPMEKTLQIKGVSPEFMARLKMAALREAKTLRQWAVDVLEAAALENRNPLPPAATRGTDTKGPNRAKR